MSNKIAHDKSSDTGLTGALRYIFEHSPASLSIAVVIMVAIYLLDKNSVLLASLSDINGLK